MRTCFCQLHLELKAEEREPGHAWPLIATLCCIFELTQKQLCFDSNQALGFSTLLLHGRVRGSHLGLAECLMVGFDNSLSL